MDNKKCTIYYYSGTHWDREWYQSFQGFRYRMVKMINDMIEFMEKNPEFKVFHLDGQTILLEDFLEIEPVKRERLKKLIQNGRVIIGPWYVMPDEFLLSGESLVRNLMIGHRIAAEWGVEAWKFGYACDVFGHIAQMPQIFNGFNIKYALAWRGTNDYNYPAYFRWQSPDESECITYRGSYSDFFSDVMDECRQKNSDRKEIADKMKEYIDKYKDRSPIPITLLMDGTDHQMIHKETPEYLKIMKEVYTDSDIHHQSLVEMGKKLEQYREQMPVKAGELNEAAKGDRADSIWLFLITHTLSSRYDIKKANDQCQTLLEKWAEPLTAILGLRGLNIQKAYIDLAYKYLIQNHPHDSICGCSIDQVHKDMKYRFDQSKLISLEVIKEVMNYEAEQYKRSKDSDTRALLIWNPLPFPRKEVITVDIDFDNGYKTKYQEPFGYEEKNSFKIFDYKGNEIPYGLVLMKKNHLMPGGRQVDLHTISLEVEAPAMGTAQYKVVPFEKASRYMDVLLKDELEVENEFIKLGINDNGTVKIYDKQSKKIFDQLLSYVDDGEIGDGWNHVNPAEDRLISSSGAECRIERVENGPARTAFKVTHYMKVPESIDYYTNGIRRSDRDKMLEIISLIGLSKGARYVDIETTIKNNAKDHRLRLKLPTGVNSPDYFVNQAFTFVERKAGIRIETQDWRECDVPEKQMSGIVGKHASDGTGLAFISAYGLHECAAFDDSQWTIAVTLFRSFRKTFQTNGEVDGQVQGELKFKYCLLPLKSDTSYADLTRLQDCQQAGMQSLSFRVEDHYSTQEPQSYFELSNSDLCMSILKRSEKDPENEVIVRFYNPSSKPSKAVFSCFKEFAAVTEVNLNENYIKPAPFDNNTFDICLEAWKIKTYCIRFLR